MSESNLEDRASVISYFIQTANVSSVSSYNALMANVLLILQSCFELKNFEGLFAVVAGLQSKPVGRLTATWKVN